MKEKILVINDDDDTRVITQLILQDKGYETYTAVDGRDGINQTLLHKPDLILLDIMMPVMDGYETCQELKKTPLTKDIPVIFLSALTMPNDKIRGLELGAVDFINDIVDQGELLARVKTQLKIKSLLNDLQKAHDNLVQKQSALNEDLQAAAMIQQSFLPSLKINIRNIRSASLWLPVNTIGGDIFNAIQCNQENVIFYIVDVSGHDVPSALVTISISQFLFQQSVTSSASLSPKEMLLALNQEYPLERFERYFTIFFLILNIDTGKLIYSCAAHPPAIILKKNSRFKLLDVGGTIIGINKSSSFDEGVEFLEDGDKVFLYSDGVENITNQNGKFYGLERFYNLLESLKNEPVDSIIKTVQKTLTTFALDTSVEDDISILGFEFNRGVEK